MAADHITTDFDTIVIGLGAAGATAASVLARSGKKVLALEACNRMGGRVNTKPCGQGVVEVGAEWMFGESPSVYGAAVEYKIAVLPQEMNWLVLRSDGNPTTEVMRDLLDLGMHFATNNSETTEPLGRFVARNMRNYIREVNPALFDKNALRHVLAFLNVSVNQLEASRDWNHVNASSTYREVEGHQRLSWHKYGFKTFFDIMMNEYNGGPGIPTLNVKLGKEVKKIEWPTDPQRLVTVHCRDNSVYTADTAIITVSLGVLKERHIHFSPPLPEEKVEAINQIAMGVVNKIILIFPYAWWPDASTLYGFMWITEDLNKVPKEDLWTTEIVGATVPMGTTNTLTLWLAGYNAVWVETLPDDEVSTKAMEVVRRFMGCRTKIPDPTAMLRSKWYTCRFTRGAFSYDSVAAAENPDARATLAAPLVDKTGRARLLFAGEATHELYFSTVHGAVESGHREALRILSQPDQTHINTGTITDTFWNQYIPQSWF